MSFVPGMRIFQIGAICALAACAVDPVPAPVDTADDALPMLPPGFVPPRDPIGNETSMREIARLQYSGIEDRRRSVIADAQTWAVVWQEAHQTSQPEPALPEVDFTNDVVVLASMGTRMSGGYSIDITSAAPSEGRLRVVVRETKPGPGCMTTGALTAPVHMVLAPRTGGTPVFVEQSETRNC